MKNLQQKFMAFGLAGLLVFSSLPAQGREISKAGQVFQSVKDGVVTVFVSYTHGSGSLVDESGLILTNSHVIKENAEHLRVKFGPGQIVEAKIVENDREHDLALLWVNLENVKNYKTLELFHPPLGEDLVLVGEEVIAVGSPIKRDVYEKNMTAGVVGKYDDVAIHHDASINGGNSGGPLLNYDGKIVGVNTFIDSDRGPAISGAVPATKVAPLIQKAKKTIATLEKPSAELLPDVPMVSYPIGELLSSNPNFFKKRDQNKYNFTSQYFNISVLTPPQGYHQLIKSENATLKKRKKRAEKKGFEVTDDEKETKNIADWHYTKPVVTVWVMPNPKLTTGSMIFNTISFIGAAGVTALSMGVGAPLLAVPFMMGKHEVKKDFLKMALVDEKGKNVCIPLETGRMPFTKEVSVLTGNAYVDFIDKSYMGVYAFDSKCFEKAQPIKFVIDVEGKDEDRTIRFPEATRNLIVRDFKPYWEHVALLETGKKVELEKPLSPTLLPATAKMDEPQAVPNSPDYLKKYTEP